MPNESEHAPPVRCRARGPAVGIGGGGLTSEWAEIGATNGPMSAKKRRDPALERDREMGAAGFELATQKRCAGRSFRTARTVTLVLR